jgi:hypothetical protein
MCECSHITSYIHALMNRDTSSTQMKDLTRGQTTHSQGINLRDNRRQSDKENPRHDVVVEIWTFLMF